MVAYRSVAMAIEAHCHSVDLFRQCSLNDGQCLSHKPALLPLASLGVYLSPVAGQSNLASVEFRILSVEQVYFKPLWS